MKNRFNQLTSKEWLAFQKSWFKAESEEKFYRESPSGPRPPGLSLRDAA